MIAKWHVEQATKHDADESHTCGCPIEHEVMTNAEILNVMAKRQPKEKFVRPKFSAGQTSNQSNPMNNSDNFDYSASKSKSTYKDRMKSEEELAELR